MIPYAEMLNKMRNIQPMEAGYKPGNPNPVNNTLMSGEITASNGVKVADFSVGSPLNVMRYTIKY
jgi:hypothetical protein